MADRLEQLSKRHNFNPVLAGQQVRPNVEGLKPVNPDTSRPLPHYYNLWSPSEKKPDLAKTTFRKPKI